MATLPWESTINEILPIEKTRYTKKDLIESIKINEDDYNYISLNVIPEMHEVWNKLIKQYFNYTKEELFDSSNIDVCYTYFIHRYNPIDFRKDLHTLNILNPVVCDIIYYNGLSVKELFTMMCDLDDIELFYVLQNFLVHFYNLIVYLTAKQIKIENINEEYFNSHFLDEEFILFMQFMVNHGYYDLSVKRLDFISDVNRFFKIKNLDYINVSKVRGRDDILLIMISKMFRVVFYQVLFDMNIKNKLEEANMISSTFEIIDELYDYFYRKIFVDMSGESEGLVNKELEIQEEYFTDDTWAGEEE